MTHLLVSPPIAMAATIVLSMLLEFAVVWMMKRMLLTLPDRRS